MTTNMILEMGKRFGGNSTGELHISFPRWCNHLVGAGISDSKTDLATQRAPTRTHLSVILPNLHGDITALALVLLTPQQSYKHITETHSVQREIQNACIPSRQAHEHFDPKHTLGTQSERRASERVHLFMACPQPPRPQRRLQANP